MVMEDDPIIGKNLKEGMRIKFSTGETCTVMNIMEAPWTPIIGHTIIITQWDDGITRRFFMNNPVGILSVEKHN